MNKAMFLMQLKAMSVGPLWLRRRAHERGQTQPACPRCHQPWMALPDGENPAEVLIILPTIITNDAEHILLENCLKAAKWDTRCNTFYLHTACDAASDKAINALKIAIAAQAPALIVVFGESAAFRLNPEFRRGVVHCFEGIPVLVTHHPEEILNNLSLKAQVWGDMCLPMTTFSNQG